MQQENILLLLIIDDSSNGAEMVTMLRRAGHGVRELNVAAPDDFKKAIEEQVPDLILCNPLTARLSAAQALTLLRESGKDIPLIVVGGALEQGAVYELLQAGARDIVPMEQAERLRHVVARELADLKQRRAYRHCEMALREAEKRCRALLDSSRDAIAYVHDGMHSYANSAYLNLFGYHNAGELEGVPILDLVASAEHDLFKEFLRGYARGASTAHGVSVSSAIEVKGVRASGEQFNMRMEFSPVSIEGEPCAQVVAHGLSELSDPCHAVSAVANETEEKLMALSRHDLLTGLYNHQYFLELLDGAMSSAVAGQGSSAFLYIELDDFQAIKDKVGVVAIDMVLVDAATLLSAKLGAPNTLARFSSAVFTVLLPDKTIHQARQIAEHVCKAVDQAVFDAAGQSVTATCSIGITLIAESTSNGHEALRQASRACGAAKATGGNLAHVYNPALHDRSSHADLRDMVGQVKNALQHNLFRLVFQPIISLRGSGAENYQVQLRMLDQQHNEVEPAKFMPAVEAAQMGVQIDRWVVEHAMQALANKRKDGHQTRFFIKLYSEEMLRDPGLLPWLIGLLKATRLPGDTLTFVIGEAAAVNALKEVKLFANGLKQLHCELAVDHFGKQADISYLKHLPLNYIKIDGTFIADLAANSLHQAKIKAINELARGMNIAIIAEWVQDASTLAVLWQYGVDYVQGYYFQKPSASLDYDFTAEGG